MELFVSFEITEVIGKKVQTKRVHFVNLKKSHNKLRNNEQYLR